MTENEAKKKWCPMTRVSNGYRVVNRKFTDVADFHPHHCCVGALCMMWRWSGDVPVGTDPRSGLAPGYCGLAGRL